MVCVEALGRVELPTNGLGNVGQGPPLNRLKHLRSGFHGLSWGKSSQSAVNCQHICQQKLRPLLPLPEGGTRGICNLFSGFNYAQSVSHEEVNFGIGLLRSAHFWISRHSQTFMTGAPFLTCSAT